MKQLHTVIQAFSVPVSLRFIEGQIPYLRQKGLIVQIICSASPDLTAFARKYGIIYQIVPFKRAITPLNDLICLWRTYRILKRVRPAIVHGNTPKAGLLSMLAARLAGIPIRIYEIHGFPFESRKGVSRWLLMLTERIACRTATQVLAVSNSVRCQAINLKITTSAKLMVPHYGSCNGVDAVGKFNPKNIDTIKLRQLNETLDLRGLVIGYVGRLTRDKGVGELADAWKMIREDYPDVSLFLIGPSELDTYPQKEQIDKLEQDSRVYRIGFVTDVEYYYALFDFILLPTYREGLPSVLLEAAAMEIPAIASRVTGTVDAVIDGKTGLFCEPYSAESLAEQIRKYLNNPDMVHEHGRNARIRVLRDFVPMDVWNAKYQLYKESLRSAGLSLPTCEKPSVPV